MTPSGLLDLTGDASESKVRQAYRRMARLTRPDFFPDDRLAAERFQEVRAAFEAGTSIQTHVNTEEYT